MFGGRICQNVEVEALIEIQTGSQHCWYLVIFNSSWKLCWTLSNNFCDYVDPCFRDSQIKLG